jgi:hypothetical protein
VLRPTTNVIPLQRRSRLRASMAPAELPVSLHSLSVAARELDDLRHCAERIGLDARWSAMEWKAASSPLLIRLAKVRKSLTDLERIRVGQWPDTDWALRLRAACSDVDRRAMDVRISIRALAGGEASSAHAVIVFSSDATLLAEAAGKLHALIASHYPAGPSGKI